MKILGFQSGISKFFAQRGFPLSDVEVSIIDGMTPRHPLVFVLNKTGEDLFMCLSLFDTDDVDASLQPVEYLPLPFQSN